MRTLKILLLSTLLALPLLFISFYIFNPPACPSSYTQQQVDASRCIVGANIGGQTIFFVVSIAIWLAIFGFLYWLTSRKHRK